MNKAETETMFSILREIFNLDLSKANEAYTKSAKKKNSKKDDDSKDNESIELNFLDADAERLGSGNGTNISGTNYTAHSESYLDKTTGSSHFEDEKRSEVLDYFGNNYQQISEKYVTEYKKRTATSPEN